MATSTDASIFISYEKLSNDSNVQSIKTITNNTSSNINIANAKFVENTKNLRRLQNRRYFLKRKQLNLETVAQRLKRNVKETEVDFSKSMLTSVEFELDKELRRILKFDVKERIIQSET